MAAINLLPGPVAISRRVRAALAVNAQSHRGAAFEQLYDQCRQALLKLSKSKYAALLMGSGTAANAMVAQELKKLPGKGLILSNGEFGARLASQAKKAGLDFDIYALEWGQAFSFDKIRALLHGKSWLWLVHCETSTGTMNLDARLVTHCRLNDVKLCLDSVSAFGNQEVDFSGVYLASSSSGKGLCSFAGISMVFYNHEPQPAQNGYDYLDLAVYHAAAHVPFTFSYNLLNALCTALLSTDFEKKFSQSARHAASMQKFLLAHGLRTPSAAGHQVDYIWTIVLPEKINSLKLGAALERDGVSIHYRNRYLVQNNWIQLAFMGVCTARGVAAVLRLLERELKALAP